MSVDFSQDLASSITSCSPEPTENNPAVSDEAHNPASYSSVGTEPDTTPSKLLFDQVITRDFQDANVHRVALKGQIGFRTKDFKGAKVKYHQDPSSAVPKRKSSSTLHEEAQKHHYLRPTASFPSFAPSFGDRRHKPHHENINDADLNTPRLDRLLTPKRRAFLAHDLPFSSRASPGHKCGYSLEPQLGRSSRKKNNGLGPSIKEHRNLRQEKLPPSTLRLPPSRVSSTSPLLPSPKADLAPESKQNQKDEAFPEQRKLGQRKLERSRRRGLWRACGIWVVKLENIFHTRKGPDADHSGVH